MSEASSGEGFGPVTYDIRWSYTVHVDGPQEFQLLSQYEAFDDPDISLLVGDLFLDGELPDPRATWHRNYTPLMRWVKAHIFRLSRDMGIEPLADYLSENPDVALEFGFVNHHEGGHVTANSPSYTQLRDIWEETFSDRLQGACMVLAEQLVNVARDHGIPAPEGVFVPDQDVEIEDEEPDEDDPTVRELTTEKTTQVWKHAKPMVLAHYQLKRHHNWQVPDSVFWDAQAHMGASEDVFPETGLGNLLTNGSHDRVHYPSTHRRELKRFDIEEIRQLHRQVTGDLINEARANGELVGQLEASIDFTKGHPWTGEIERNAEGDNIEPWILGYTNDNDTRTQYYFQWASIQIVGLDIPLVLDALPVRRGRSRADIVDDLVGHATDMVDDIEVVYMDREFDPDGVKESCEKHGVYYLNAAKVRQSDDTPDMLREEGKTVHISEQRSVDANRPARKEIYLPSAKFNTDDGEDDGDGDGDDGLVAGELEDFVAEETDIEDGLVADIAEELHELRQEEDVGADEGDDDEITFVKFETNHPAVSARNEDGERASGTELVHMVSRFIRRYKNRWGIENGYKKIKQFLPRSGSDDEVLRFFNFAFACTLYNSWRLVDLLVKLTVEDDPDYTPLVTAQRFREIAQDYYGLGVPPPDA